MPYEARWTEENVNERLMEAACIMRRLPPVKVKGFVSSWPQIVYTAAEQFHMEQKSALWTATPEQVTRMEEACGWLRYLSNIDDRRLLWLRAERVRWRLICERLGISRTTATERWKNGLRTIIQALNKTS